MKKKLVIMGAIMMSLALSGCRPSDEKLAAVESARDALETVRQEAEDTYLDVADTSLRSELDQLGVKVAEIEAIDFTKMSNKKIDAKIPEINSIIQEYNVVQQKLTGIYTGEQEVIAEQAKNRLIDCYIINKTGLKLSSIVLHDITADSYSENLISDGEILADGYTLMGIKLPVNADSSEWEFIVTDDVFTQRFFTCESLKDISGNSVSLSFAYNVETDSGTVSFGGYFSD
jgi:hypothetical protein